jgi:hypothetical protein
MNESETRTEEEEEKRRMDAEGDGTYAHRTTTMKRIFLLLLFFSR